MAKGRSERLIFSLWIQLPLGYFRPTTVALETTLEYRCDVDYQVASVVVGRQHTFGALDQWFQTFAPCSLLIICQNVSPLSKIIRLKRCIVNNMERYATKCHIILSQMDRL